MLELTQGVLRLSESRFGQSELVFMPLPQDDPPQRQPDNDMAEAKLGWERTVANFSQVIGQPEALVAGKAQ